MTTRLTITLTDAQFDALTRLSAKTGASKQSMIGLAVSSWLSKLGLPPSYWRHAAEADERAEVEERMAQRDFDEIRKVVGDLADEETLYFTVSRDGVEVAWLEGWWADASRQAIYAIKMRLSRFGEEVWLAGKVFRYETGEDESVRATFWNHWDDVDDEACPYPVF